MRIHRTAATVAVMLFFGVLVSCTLDPDPAQIESVSMQAAQRGDHRAEQRLAIWAADGLPVAQRELGLLYRTRPGQQDKAFFLLQSAAKKGDAEAAFQLGEIERARSASGKAAAWYRQAAATGHAKAALMLGLLLKNGEGVARDMGSAVHWLGVSAAAGNPHAMFLLSNAYAAGDGVKADPKHARALLESAADLEYPAAIQQLALVKETGDAFSARDSAEAQQLLKEAAEHRRANARRF